jgi:hypothetical protein
MLNDADHPNVPVRDWTEFRDNPSPFLAREVIDRKETQLPGKFAPLARGVIIASDHLLRRAGHRCGRFGAIDDGWRKTHAEHFPLTIGRKAFIRPEGELCVRQCGRLWTVERLGPYRWGEPENYQVLSFLFGSTPICTRSYTSAMRLAVHFEAHGLPLLRWIDEIPKAIRSKSITLANAKKRGHPLIKGDKRRGVRA